MDDLVAGVFEVVDVYGISITYASLSGLVEPVDYKLWTMKMYNQGAYIMVLIYFNLGVFV